MMKLKNIIIAVLLSILFFAGFSCDDELSISLSYPEMLEQAFNETGEGRIVPVTIENAIEVDGSIATNGRYLFYTSNRYQGNYDIYLRSMRDITTLKVIGHASSDYSSVISPNGKYLAFVSEREDPEGDIYVLKLNPGSLVRKERDIKKKAEPLDSDSDNISQIVESETGMKKVVRDANPAWSPDSKYIAFSSERSGIENIFICNRNGKDKKQITVNGGMYPNFSPDGKKIVFVSYRNNTNKGDIYVIDIETREEIQITDSISIEMNPAFGATSSEIVYTLIDKDTNSDGIIDLKDRSVIQYKNLLTNHSYPLTFYSNSSFSPRYFPFYSLKYPESKEVNYRGVIVFSQQIGNNIDLNIIPEYGVIPKRRTAREQYDLALRYLNEFNDYDKYNDALLRVYYFFHDTTDVKSRIFISKAIRARAIEYLINRQRDKIGELVELLSEISNEEDKDYVSLTIDYLNAIMERGTLESVLIKAVEDYKETEYSPYVMEDLADFYKFRKKNIEAISLYKQILGLYPEYERKMYINESLAVLDSLKTEEAISTYYLEILAKGADYQKDNVLRSLSDDIMKIVPYKRLLLMDSYISVYGAEKDRASQLITILSVYIKQLTLFQQSDDALSSKELTTVLEKTGSNSILYYRINKLLADISLREKDIEKEEEYLRTTINNYQARWRQNDLDEVVLRLIDIYEDKGRVFEKKGELKKAVSIYKGYTKFLSGLKSKKITKFENIYNEYAARSHILYIDTSAKLKGDLKNRLVKLIEEYEENADKARKAYDKAHIYGLGYLYSRYALLLDKEYQDGYELISRESEEEIDSELIAKYLYKSVEALNWALFMDDSFSDPYLLKGWLYQYVDYRREYEEKKEYPLARHLAAYFPVNLLEDNIELYEKALQANNELRYPEKEGNIHLNLGNTYFMIRNYPEAINHYKAASKYKETFSSKEEEAYFSYHLAYCHYQMGDNKTALNEFKRVIAIFKDISGGKINRTNVKAFLQVYRYYALIARLEGDYTNAINWYTEMLNVAAKYNVNIDRARYYQEIADCNIELRKYNIALENINRADRIIDKDDAREYWIHNLDARLFGFIPLPLFDFGDIAVVGEGRIFREFDLETKALYSLALKEKIHYSKGDYRSVVKVHKDKLKILEGKNRIIHNEIRLRTLNNLGHAYFILSDYKQSIKYFNEAWKTADDLNNNEAVFMTIQNITSLYSFILENDPGYFKEPVKEINEKIIAINKYSSAYEKKEYEAKLKSLEDTKKKRGLGEPTVEEKNQLALEVKEKAKKKYFKLEINKATLEFYKAELMHDSYVRSLEKEKKDASGIIYESNKTIFNYYFTASEIFEKAAEGNSVSQSMKLKLMLNASICRQRLGQLSEAYTVLDKALEISRKYRFDDITYLILYKQARFIEKNSKLVGVPSNKAAELYESSILIIENLPQQFYNREMMVNNLYDDYTRYLINNGEEKKALLTQVRKRAVNLINITYLASPSFGSVSEKNLFDSYKNIVSRLISLRTRYSVLLEKHNSEKHEEVARVKNEMLISEGNLSVIQYEDYMMNRLIKQNSRDINTGDNIVCEFMLDSEGVHAWAVKGKEISYDLLPLNGKTEKSVINSYLAEKSTTSNPLYVIYNDAVLSIRDIDKSIDSTENNSKFMYICSYHDIGFLERTGKSLNQKEFIINKDLKDIKKEKKDLVEFSVVLDNRLPVLDSAELLFSKKIRPSLFIKQYNKESVSYINLLFYASLYSGSSNIVLTSNSEKYKEFSEYIQFNNLQNGKMASFAFGKNYNIFPEESEFIDVAQNFYSRYENSLFQADPESARFYLFRWHEASKSDSGSSYDYLLNLARIYDYEQRPEEAVKELEKINLKEITDEQLFKRIADNVLYYLLRTGNIDKASEYLEAIPETEIGYKSSIDYLYFSNLIGSIRNYLPYRGEIPSISVEKYKLAILQARFCSTFGKNKDAESVLQLVESTDIMNYSDLLFVNSIGNLESSNIRDPRIIDINSIKSLENPSEVKQTYLSTVENRGLYDDISKYAVLITLNRVKDLFISNRINEFINTDSMVSIAKEGHPGNKILFCLKVSDFLTQIGDYENAQLLLNEALNISETESLEYIRDYINFKISKIHLFKSDYKSFESTVSSLDSVPETNSIYKYIKLFEAEVSYRNERYERSQDELVSIISENNDVNVTRRLLDLLNSYYLHIDEKSDPALFISNNYDKLVQTKNLIINSRNSENRFDRLSLATEVIDCFIKAGIKANNITLALSLSDQKKQIKYINVIPFDVQVKEGVFDKKTEDFLKGLNVLESEEQIFSLLSEEEAIISFDNVQNDIYVWVIGNNSIKIFPFENGFNRYKELHEMYEANLISIYNMASCITGFNTLFSSVLEEAKLFNRVHIVNSSDLDYLPMELLGEPAMIEIADVSYLPAVSVFNKEQNEKPNATIVVLSQEEEPINDALENLALKQSGFSIVKEKTERGLMHIQDELFWDYTTKKYIVENYPYNQKIVNQQLIYISTNYLSLNEINSFVLYNMALGNSSVILNRTSLRDVNSAIVVREFYTSFRNGEKRSKAFSNAIRKVYYNSSLSHPSYWSKTRLYGAEK